MNVVTSYDHLAVSAMPDPHPIVAEARNQCPVAHSDQYDGFWIVHRYGDVGSVARNPQVFCSGKGDTIPHHGFPLAVPPIEIDPPDHIKYRTPLLERLSPGAVARMEPMLRSNVTALIDEFIERGEVEFTNELTIPLPAIAICSLLHIPAEDQKKFHEWAVQQMQVNSGLEAWVEEIMYFNVIYEDRTANPIDPRDDLPTYLMQIEIDGEPLSQMHFVAMMTELLGAGLDTTANTSAHILLLLSQRLDLRQELLEDFSLIPMAIEEMLRYITPLPVLCRTATQDTEIDGQRIGEGERVQLNWISANHDPDEFDDPETIHFRRTPNRHLAFGAGPHRCAGAHLARAELKVLLEEVLTRLPDYRIDIDGVAHYGGITRGISALPATFSPGPRKA